MKCANCGAKLQVGSVYCSFCGKEAQIVSDYSILEDEFLQDMLNGQEKNRDLIKESMGTAGGSQPGQDKIANTRPARSASAAPRPGQGANAYRTPKGQGSGSQNARKQDAGGQWEGRQGAGASGQAGKAGVAPQGKGSQPSGKAGKHAKEASPSGKKGGSSRRKRKPVGWAVAAILLMVFLLVDILFVLNHSRNNSYDYQMGQAEKHYSSREYEEAEQFLLRAIELSDGQLEGPLLLAEVYRLQGKAEKAIKTLQDMIEASSRGQGAAVPGDSGSVSSRKDYEEAYRKLIQVYEEEEDYAAIYELYKEAEDEDILQLFEGYQVEAPEFVQEEGVYEQMVSIELSSQAGCETFYTIDGSDPKQGLEYQGPIQIEPGNSVRIRAISRNEYGVYSEEAEGSFEIDLPKPDMPRVSPMGGNFYEPQAITVYVPSGCSVYYSWDGTAPTEASSRYMGPIDMPEGNNILSLILVDEYGRYSDVLRCNYIYFP